MNTLVANISTFSYAKNKMVYKICIPGCETETIEAIHTNESVLKCVAEITEVKRTGGIQKVLALVSKATIENIDDKFQMTAFDYYKQHLLALAPACKIIMIPIQIGDTEDRDFAEILDDICQNIGPDDVVYIDSAGGLRTHANIIQLLTKVLRFTGIKNPMSIYSDIQNRKEPKLVNTANYDRMVILADGFNEFMTTGKSDQLNSCLAQCEEDNYKSLLQVMKEFSDKIRLSNVDTLEDTIQNLKTCLSQCQQTENNSIETVILNQFLPIFREKLLGENENEVDYEKVINWCLENALIQQAATIFVEKLPKHLFKLGILQFKDENGVEERFTKNKGLHTDLYSFALYQELFDVSFKDENKKAVNSLKAWLKENDSEILDHNISDVCRAVSSFCNKSLKSNRNDDKTKIIRKWMESVPPFKSIQSFKNSLANNERILNELLGMAVDQNKDGDTYSKKLNAIEKLKDNGNFNPQYQINADYKNFISFMYAYVYMKGMRNQMNHANGESNLTEQHKSILHSLGYDFTKNTLDVVKRNVQLALKAFSMLRFK